jgi:hypothetical protein
LLTFTLFPSGVDPVLVNSAALLFKEFCIEKFDSNGTIFGIPPHEEVVRILLFIELQSMDSFVTDTTAAGGTNFKEHRI